MSLFFLLLITQRKLKILILSKYCCLKAAVLRLLLPPRQQNGCVVTQQRPHYPTRSPLYPNECTTTLLDLPSEIIFEITKYICLDDDLCQLVRTCRLAFNLLNLDLYKRSCKRDNFVLLWAAKTGSTVTVTHALQAGADSSVKAGGLIKLLGDISLHRRSPSPTFGLIQTCHAVSEKTPLVLAAENGHSNVVLLLLQDPRVMVFGMDALHATVRNGHPPILELLLTYDEIIGNLHDQPDNTLLHLAAAKGHDEVISLLLSKTDVRADATDASGSTALHVAAKNGHTQTVKTLLEHDGTNVNVKDGRGNTPLHVAVMCNHISTAEAILHHGRTDVSIKNRHGLQALHLIARMGLRQSPTCHKQLRFS